MKGLFITFEGPDGSGKTTQMKLLGERLASMGADVVRTREPGGTPIGDRLREIVLSPDNGEMMDETEILLYAASRAQHVREVIVPALERGKVVICDRFVDASIAYQGYGLGRDPEEVARINRFATGGLRPHRTYLLDVPAAVSRERLLSRALAASGAGLDRIEQKEREYHERVRDGFLLIAKAEPQRVMLIDANRTVADIAADIHADFDRLLQQQQ
ncbi:dTMP kinase [Paenibacillus antri]|uniref:Thymidylate kinase n=1 Tax=Paenibacillus antri TaxID=2582848 RepID=A0A5R9G383_9BACL|nr:dTMP kinase [Paenibacillus antri]TLS48580.1 dTMP kinase [Paenibacillus antri]